MAYTDPMRTVAVTIILVLAGCGDPGWVLPEADAVEIVDAELAGRGIEATARDHEVVTALLTLQLDGWDPVALVGYEYAADPDPELGEASPYSELDGWEALQTAVDEAVDADTHVLVIHAWAHETEDLARDQFLGNLQGRLDALGL
jgi:hypothetical protein